MSQRKQIEKFRHFNRFYTEYLGLLGTFIYNSSVNLSEARILYELDSHPDSSAKDLIKNLNLDKGYISRLLKRFTKQGWIVESSTDRDARIKKIRLTEAGKELIKELYDKASEQAEKALNHLSAPDKKQLLTAMNTIENMLSK